MTPHQMNRVASDDALTAIYRMANDEQTRVIAARLGERLGVSAPTVGAMLQRLVRDGFVRIDRHRTVTLTDAGLERAESMIRRHRLAECLLVDLLGLDWWRAYDEAHLIEHAISNETERLILARLGCPARSPFGYPIPGVSAESLLSRRTLKDVDVGEPAVVERVFEEDADLLAYFDGATIRPGATVRIVERSRTLRMYTVQVDDETTSFAAAVAARIWVNERAS